MLCNNFMSCVSIAFFYKNNIIPQLFYLTPKYGLAATVWTDNLSKAHRIAANLHTGIVWVNCWLLRDLRTPFGGVKNSGVGREGGFEALQFFTEPKNVCIKL